MGKYHCYDDARAVCPYFCGSNGLELRCEGACGCDKLVLRYRTTLEREKQRSRHCDNMRGYMQCALYAAHAARDE